MSNQVILFSSIQIAAFRGIPNKISLDLSAPLTVLVAPNGTGKSSICHAAEWLLTGAAGDKTDNADLRCLTTRSGMPMSVRGQLGVRTASMTLHRVQSSEVLCTFGTGSSKKWGNGWLLDHLAPDAINGNVPPTTAANIRRRWIRGTRFPSGEDIAVLIDSKAEYVEQRKQIYADLLGVGHLAEAVRHLKRFIKEVRPRADDLERLLQAREGALKTVAGDVPDADAAVAEEVLRQARALLGLVESEASVTFEQRLAEADAALTDPRNSLEGQRQALAVVGTAWPEWTGRADRIERLRAGESEARLRSERWRLRQARVTESYGGNWVMTR